MIEAKIILDSVCPKTGTRLTTIQYRLPKCLLAQLNTHCAMAKLAVSSRAKSLTKYLEDELYLPEFIGEECLGMKSQKEIDTKDEVIELIKNFYNDQVVPFVRELEKHKVHREYINRYLEPFKYTDGLITATEWDNFLKLRAKGKGAQEEISILAEQIKHLLKTNEPQPRSVHLPYIKLEELEEDLETKIVKSIARCARVSYGNHGKEYSFERDYTLFRNLYINGHMSPFEMVAISPKNVDDLHLYNIYKIKEGEYYSNRFKNWVQLRENPYNLLNKTIKRFD